MKKNLLIILPIIIIFILSLFIYNKTIPKEKIYLSDKYYNNSKFIELNSKDITKLNNETYLLFTYTNYCTLPIPCEYIFEEFMTKYNISIISIPFEDYKKTSYYKKVKYAPTIIIINKGKIVTYLDANSDKDLDKYQDINEFTNWIKQYVYLKENQNEK